LEEDDVSDTERTTVACHRVIEAASKVFELAPGRYRDFVHHPKPTGYQAIHFGLTVPEELTKDSPLHDRLQTVEIQVRTEDLHRRAEYGEWVHFKYKIRPAIRGTAEDGLSPNLRAKQEWSLKWQEFFTTNIAFRSEEGEMHLIGRTATYCDAAYGVSGSLHPLRVEIAAPTTADPAVLSLDDDVMYGQMIPWCRVRCIESGEPENGALYPARLGDVKTRRARRALAGLIEPRAGRDAVVQQGKRIFSEAQDLGEVWSYSLEPSLAETADALEALAGYVEVGDLRSVDDFYCFLGRGESHVGAMELARKLRKEVFDFKACERHMEMIEARWDPARLESPLHWETLARTGLLPFVEFGMPKKRLLGRIWLASCCGPLPGDQVAAVNVAVRQEYQGRLRCAHYSAVHRKECPAIPDGSPSFRWTRERSQPQTRPFHGHLELLVIDMPGVMNLITSAIGQQSDVNIREVVAYPVYDSASLVWLELEVRDVEHITAIKDRAVRNLGDRFILSADRRVPRPS
jgi:(p)ppGpp synthase/HD superfamily hydrolase